MKLGSRRLWPAVLTAAGLLATGAAGGGCIVDSHHGHDHGSSGGDSDTTTPPPATEKPMIVTIDTDATIEATPGAGVGMYVEYQTGGHWRVWATCDTSSSGYFCGFDAYVSVDSSSTLTGPKGEALEGSDAVVVDSDGSVHLVANTDTDTDGMTFDTTPGAIVRLEMYLDGYPQSQFVYWFGGGVLHTGAPTDPIDFDPSAD